MSERPKTRFERRGGKVFRVVELPAVPPPAHRPATSRYSMDEVEKPGSIERPRKRRRPRRRR